MPIATIAELALAAIQLAQNLAARAHQSGEMTDEQRSALAGHALDIFALYDKAMPPPPGVQG